MSGPFRTCPYCFKRLAVGQACQCRPTPQREYRRSTERKRDEPWRSTYASKEYQDSRQVALERTQGRCAVCGKVIARKTRGKWACIRGAGGTHHNEQLRNGGGNAVGNITPLCTEHHAQADAKARRRK